jgi:hypothetical protein
MLGHDAGFILHGHLIAGKRHHFGAVMAMKAV